MSSINLRSIGTQHYVLEFDMTAIASSSGFTSLASTPHRVDGYVIKAVTHPGTVGPTDDYDITLTDSEGCDCMGGTLVDRDIATPEQAVPLIGTAYYGDSFVEGPLTCNIANNLVVDATTKVSVYFKRP